MLKEAQRAKSLSIAELLKQQTRVADYSVQACDIYLDFSKNLIDKRAWQSLLQLLQSSRFFKAREELFAGEYRNHTEQRGVGHLALRSTASFYIDGVDVAPKVAKQLARMRELVQQIHSQAWLGYAGEPIRNIVNIGIGGSDLGPKMVVTALKPYARTGVRVHYVSNIDGANLYDVLENCSTGDTMFVISSKSFTTAETLTNATLAKNWFLSQGGNEKVMHRHFVAITSNTAKASIFGIHPSQQFEIWDWVGGRFSLWSAIGISIVFAVGFDCFLRLLKGARQMDQHFYNAPLGQNIPVVLALLGVWYINGMGAQTQMIIPYDYSLRYFTEHLQQLDMESNGKCVDINGQKLKRDSAPVIWGSTGTNGQHAYFQLLHQGNRLVPSEFILVKNSHYFALANQQQLLANAIAQMEALMRGRSKEEARAEMSHLGFTPRQIELLLPYRVFSGNQPSTAIVLDMLTPESLGALIAAYEHKVFTQGVIWQINSFDQWGVELGKKLAANIIHDLDGSSRHKTVHDASTQALIDELLGQGS